MKIFLFAVVLILLYFGIEVGIFFYKYNHYPKLPIIDQTDKTFGATGKVTLRYIAAGDSTAVGVGASSSENTYTYAVAQYLAKTSQVEYKNIAVIGATTKDLLDKQLEKIVAYKPDVITISIGANDATHLASAQAILENYKTIISQLKTQTQATIYITDIANFYGANILPWFYISLIEYRSKGINKQILALADARVRIVDIHNFGWSKYPDRSSTYAADQFHPSDLGYQNWAGAFIDQLSKP